MAEEGVWTGKKPEGIEKTVNVLDKLHWTVQPPMGMIKGEYLCAENYFAKHHAMDEGYHGCLRWYSKTEGWFMLNLRNMRHRFTTKGCIRGHRSAAALLLFSGNKGAHCADTKSTR